jgi:hypothetical protein
VIPAAHPGEPGHPVLQFEPVVGHAALEYHGGVAVADTAQEEPPPADVEPAREPAAGHDGWWGVLAAESLYQGRLVSRDADRQRTPAARCVLDDGQCLALPGWVGEADNVLWSPLGQGSSQGADDRLRRHDHGEELGREVLADLGLGQGGGPAGQLLQHPAELPAQPGGGQGGRGAAPDPVGVDVPAGAGSLVAALGSARCGGADAGQRRHQGPGSHLSPHSPQHHADSSLGSSG